MDRELAVAGIRWFLCRFSKILILAPNGKYVQEMRIKSLPQGHNVWQHQLTKGLITGDDMVLRACQSTFCLKTGGKEVFQLEWLRVAGHQSGLPGNYFHYSSASRQFKLRKHAFPLTHSLIH